MSQEKASKKWALAAEKLGAASGSFGFNSGVWDGWEANRGVKCRAADADGITGCNHQFSLGCVFPAAMVQDTAETFFNDNIV